MGYWVRSNHNRTLPLLGQAIDIVSSRVERDRSVSVYVDVSVRALARNARTERLRTADVVAVRRGVDGCRVGHRLWQKLKAPSHDGAAVGRPGSHPALRAFAHARAGRGHAAVDRGTASILVQVSV